MLQINFATMAPLELGELKYVRKYGRLGTVRTPYSIQHPHLEMLLLHVLCCCHCTHRKSKPVLYVDYYFTLQLINYPPCILYNNDATSR